MSANQSDRRLLIDQLAWQEAMGIDEALLDDAADDTTATLSALAAPAGAYRPATTPAVESPVSYTHLTLPTIYSV